MKSSDFEQRFKALAEDSDRESCYKQLIQDLIAELNDADTTRADKITVLEQLEATDKYYYEILGTPIEKKVCLTRHGHCSQKRKGYGLIPNTSVEESALEAMEQSSEYTEAMLDYSDLQIVVSPLTRAMQTAGKLIHGNNNSIFLNAALTENSLAPSGSDIRNIEQLREMYSNISHPFKKFLFFLALPSASLANKSKEELLEIRKHTWNPLTLLKLYFAINFYYSDEQLRGYRDEAIDKLCRKSPNITEKDKDPESNRDVTMTKEDKVGAVAQLIQDASTTCLWLIGHGNNFKNFFMALFGDQSLFDYTETRILYLIPSNDAQEGSIVTPPYKLNFNQETGEIEGTYTGSIQRNIIPLSKILPERAGEPSEGGRSSHVIMQEQGLTVSPLEKDADEPLDPYIPIKPKADDSVDEPLDNNRPNVLR